MGPAERSDYRQIVQTDYLMMIDLQIDTYSSKVCRCVSARVRGGVSFKDMPIFRSLSIS